MRVYNNRKYPDSEADLEELLDNIAGPLKILKNLADVLHNHDEDIEKLYDEIDDIENYQKFQDRKVSYCENYIMSPIEMVRRYMGS